MPPFTSFTPDLGEMAENLGDVIVQTMLQIQG